MAASDASGADSIPEKIRYQHPCKYFYDFIQYVSNLFLFIGPGHSCTGGTRAHGNSSSANKGSWEIQWGKRHELSVG